MKKYIFTSVFLLAVVFSLYRISLKNKNSHITELMLKNIECLATPESPSVDCYYSGTLDCPRHTKPVLYYW